MVSLRLLTERPLQILLFATIMAVFGLAACSNSQKKEEKKNPTKNTRQKNSQIKPGEKNSNENKSDTTKIKAITAKRGKKIAKSNGCFSCHTTNGTEKSAPTFKNLYGRKTTLKNNLTVTADSAYIAQSIKDPDAKIVKGFSPLMPPFNYLKDDQIASIIEYIKSISE
jgi:mono/diheme cytochrome c family protein